MNENSKLKMSFDPKTIEHLGIKMYSRIPSAIAELIANAYDAGATQVDVKLYDNTQEGKSIQVQDNGWGMSFDEVNDKFLRIGRNRRDDGAQKSPCGTRKATGKKGLGKLALFGIGNTIEIKTVEKGSGSKISFTLDWDELKGSKGDYLPNFKIESSGEEKQGTLIILKNIKRSSDFNETDLAVSLSKLFNFFDSTFKCFVSLNDNDPVEVTNDLKYNSIDNKEFEWKFPDFASEVDAEYEHQDKITGKIIATEKPLKPGLRGITLFANGRLANEPEFFGVIESSHVFSYLTGWLEIDFIDDMKEDVIATNRQSLNWDEPGLPELQHFLQRTIRAIETNWREKRKKKRKEEVERQAQINIEEWYGTQSIDVKEQLEPIVKSIVEDSELTNSQQSEIIRKVHTLIPEYAKFHWRHLHSEIQDASLSGYASQDFYKAFIEAVKRYINSVKSNSASVNPSEVSMMGEVFGKDKEFSVTRKYKKPDGSVFPDLTNQSIEDGHKFLSMGIVAGARNPISHEEITDLRESGLFSEVDCLDALSLISHLYRRFDDALEILDAEESSETSVNSG